MTNNRRLASVKEHGIRLVQCNKTLNVAPIENVEKKFVNFS